MAALPSGPFCRPARTSVRCGPGVRRQAGSARRSGTRRGAPPAHPDLIASAGWLSSLLAISASDLGDHAEALVWCADTERRGRQAQHPELLGWAALTRAVIAYYQGGARLSAATARRGQANAAPGTVAYLKLTAHEMRSLAMLGDAAGMTEANRRAVVAMDRLGPHAHSGGVYSTPRAGDPPYTATSLLLTGQYRNAEQVTRRLVETATSPVRSRREPSRRTTPGRC